MLMQLVDFILHIDKHLDVIMRDYGVWTYVILFVIVFCETGLVVTPFLPGDSLLFAAGALASRGALDVNTMAALLIIAAIIGDTVNYHIGYYLGPKVLSSPDSRIFKKQYLDRTQRFYEKYGGKTIVLARFVPIVRTFAPFLAGVGRMRYSYFVTYNILGAILWVAIFAYAGFFFGEIPAVKRNFTLVILAIIIISVLPIAFEYIKARKEAKNQPA
ncbi:MAG: DedA family protein [Deltaproteobacteria bacterium]|nr:DedA family protein [Deltaproteobacteria bacterium]